MQWRVTGCSRSGFCCVVRCSDDGEDVDDDDDDADSESTTIDRFVGTASSQRLTQVRVNNNCTVSQKNISPTFSTVT